MFIDVFESWKLFSKYRRGNITCDAKQYHEELKKANITLDNDTSRLIKHIDRIQEKLGMKKKGQ